MIFHYTNKYGDVGVELEKSMTIKQNNDTTIFRDPAAYLCFSFHVQEKNRYIHNQDTVRFLNAVRETIKNREKYFPKDTKFWRARLGSAKSEGVKFHDKAYAQKDVPYPPKEMKPVAGKAIEGRVNPKGIPCLYLATNIQTAIQEVRPWLNAKITVAKFQTVKNLRLVDCSRNIKIDGIGNDNPGSSSKKEETLIECEERTWSWIARSFSIPVNPSDDEADYVPTQILAELFRAEGYDGVVYNSQFVEGQNVALFDSSLAEPVDIKLYNITKIPPFKFEEVHCQFARSKT
jgi:hypothetical protein